MPESNRTRFKDKIVLITGSGRGIGLSIAVAFAKEGGVIAANDHDAGILRAGLNEVQKYSPMSRGFLADVSKASQVNGMIQEVMRTLGKIDVLVNNAGIAYPTPSLEVSEEEWDRVMDVNLKGAFLVAQQVLPLMKERRYGKIIMVSSLSGKMGGVATGIHYSISKGGLIVMTRQFAREFGSFGINVNAVAPSFAETNLLKDLRLDNKKEELARLNVIQRLASPEDVANATLFLASDSSSFITGETINVNGGRFMD